MFSGPHIPALRKKGLHALHLRFLPHPRYNNGGAQHRGEKGGGTWTPKDYRLLEITVFHEHKPRTRASGKETASAHGWRVWERDLRVQRTLPFLFQGNVHFAMLSPLLPGPLSPHTWWNSSSPPQVLALCHLRQVLVWKMETLGHQMARRQSVPQLLVPMISEHCCLLKHLGVGSRDLQAPGPTSPLL